MPTTVAIPSELTGQTILSFPTGLPEGCLVDASNLSFIEPMGLVQLVLLLQHAAALSPKVKFIAPSAYGAYHYLARMGFYKHVPETVTLDNAVDAGAVHRRGSCDVLIPVRGFKSDWDVEDMFEDVAKFLRRMLTDKIISGTIYSTLGAAIPELAGNAATHANSPCGGYIAAQIYKRGSYLAVGDIGMGIRGHLTKNPNWAYLQTDEEAIAKALETGVSGTSDRRGWGFDYVLEELRSTAGAQLFIRSGNGWVKTNVGQNGRRQTSGSDSTRSFPGTIIQLIVQT
ncbi:MAG: hypothetical protein M1380_01055 [Chloroflexi bacterium]|nr:hypothetical protein [Chloroflexota bacterium]